MSAKIWKLVFITFQFNFHHILMANMREILIVCRTANGFSIDVIADLSTMWSPMQLHEQILIYALWTVVNANLFGLHSRTKWCIRNITRESRAKPKKWISKIVHIFDVEMCHFLEFKTLFLRPTPPGLAQITYHFHVYYKIIMDETRPRINRWNGFALIIRAQAGENRM